MAEQEPTRRERYRRQTVAEIKAAAMAQLCASGAETVSLNAIARSMAMSAPALYRYFACRDELLADLAVDVHLTLADALEAAAGRKVSAASRVTAVAHAYRDWALARPHAYHLAYETTYGSAREHAADRIATAAQRCMDVFLGVVAEAGEPARALPPALDKQLRGRQGNQHRTPAAVRHFGLIWWSRLHGLISLELGRHLAATGVDAALLYRTEVEAMLDALRPRYGATA
ncbi:TetR/AcrR family transcriptional regulator [Amycolatopsis vastitatis]|uniref:TetR family transcriptional regulator n=1 Tax=Amycolatopsis vastitatis TaxID=1905142 RepID=A0A229T4Y6_9PSEU|nr:TetR/AcrR family transcriptional regulator [Amycolatopsis vastitatis]OXM66326.1 TetR family transcriptional regulator [Amycolatopsis vastitatis]